MEKQKELFYPGELVQIRQNLPNKPIMLVIKKEISLLNTSLGGGDNEGTFKGLRCRWFTKDYLLQEAVFNTKDLIKVKDE